MHEFLEKEQCSPKSTANFAAIYELAVTLKNRTTKPELQK